MLQWLVCLSPNLCIQEGKDYLVLHQRGRETSLQAHRDAIECLRLATFQLSVPFQSGDANENDTPVHKSLFWLFLFLSKEAVRG